MLLYCYPELAAPRHSLWRRGVSGSMFMVCHFESIEMRNLFCVSETKISRHTRNDTIWWPRHAKLEERSMVGATGFEPVTYCV